MVVLHGESKLPQVLPALQPPRRRSRRLDSWDEQGNKHARDGQYDQHFNKRYAKCGSS